MSGKRLLSVLLSLVLVMPVTLPCRAQEETVAQPANRQPENLQEVVDEIVWRPEQQGLLLIVSPATVSRQILWTMQDTVTTARPLLAFLPPRSEQGLRLSTLEQYFPSVVVPCGDVTVLAPAKMMVLNYENLPQPSAFTGLKPNDSFQLLQGSLTKTQWQQTASPNGIGLADLNAEQRELFLAAFPAGMRVTQNKDGRYTSAPLEENQRRGIRFRVVRSMNWSFANGPNSTISVGRESQTRTNLTVEQDVDLEKQQRQAYGTELMSEVTSQFKPSQLAYKWEGLDTPVDLTKVKTVGDLVAKLRETTRVELYCDPRYARLPVYLRGSQARAGNLAKALARGVTGTWRRLENAYVLTDDLVGLGARHARMADWLSRNAMLRAEVDSKLTAALRETKPAQYVGYAEDDAFAPSDKLMAKYQKYQASLRAPRKPGDSAPDYNKAWSVTELSATAQEEIRRQVAEFANGQYGDDNRNISGEAVRLNVDTAMKVSIPGVGWADAPFNTNLMQFSEEQNFPSPQPPPTRPEPQPLPTRLKIRALVIDLKRSDKLGPVYLSAQRAGFTEVWGDVTSVPIETAKAAVHASHAAKLKFRALVPALRQKVDKWKSKNVDVNLLGETYTQYLARILQDGTLPMPYYLSEVDRKQTATVMESAVLRQRERGDWRDPSAPDTVALIEQEVESLLKAVPVDGIVLNDITPPGYTPHFGFNETGGIEGGGYSVARRLALLRQTGVDPVDLSPVDNGFNRYSGQRLRQRNYLELQLPLFPDHGINVVEDTLNVAKVDRVNAPKPVTGDVAKQWDTLRQDDMEAAWKKIEAHARKVAGDVPVWFSRQAAAIKPGYSYGSVESRDRIADAPEKPARTGSSTSDVAQSQVAPETSPYDISPKRRAESSVVLFSLDLGSQVAVPGVLSRADMLAMMTGYLFDPQTPVLTDYDGVVLDLSRETSGDLLAEVEVLPAPKETPGAITGEAATPAAPSKTARPRPRPKRP